MNRKDLKQIRSLLTSKSAQIKGTTASTEAVQARAAVELSAISNTYETAALAGDLIRAQLAMCTNPKDLAALTKALRDVMAVQTEARQEARDTIENLNSATPPTSRTEGVVRGYADSEILPDSEER